jgi:hypothetical protein
MILFLQRQLFGQNGSLATSWCIALDLSLHRDQPPEKSIVDIGGQVWILVWRRLQCLNNAIHNKISISKISARSEIYIYRICSNSNEEFIFQLPLRWRGGRWGSFFDQSFIIKLKYKIHSKLTSNIIRIIGDYYPEGGGRTVAIFQYLSITVFLLINGHARLFFNHLFWKTLLIKNAINSHFSFFLAL